MTLDVPILEFYYYPRGNIDSVDPYALITRTKIFATIGHEGVKVYDHRMREFPEREAEEIRKLIRDCIKRNVVMSSKPFVQPTASTLRARIQ